LTANLTAKGIRPGLAPGQLERAAVQPGDIDRPFEKYVSDEDEAQRILIAITLTFEVLDV